MATEWRERATPKTADDIEFVIGAALAEAERWLDEHGAFFPFGYVLTKTGEDAEIVMASEAAQSDPDPTKVHGVVVAAALARRDQLRAVAIASNVEGPDGVEVVRVEMEHADGIALDCYFGYDLAKKPLAVLDRQINEIQPQFFGA